MGFQRVFLVKRFLTILTFEWLMRCMRTPVSVKSGGESESFSTNFTTVRSFTSMSVNVSLKVTFLIEAFATVFTLVQSNSRVSSHVVLQVSKLFEATTTLATLVRLFTSVNVSMYFHVHFLMETLATKIANKRLVVCVCSHVSVQIGRATEALFAYGARMGLYCSVSQFVTS